MKIAILQSCDETYAQCLWAAADTHKAYAKRHGYGYHWTIGNLSPIPETANFNRYYLLRQAIAKQHYDWAVWIDADAIIIDSTIKLESIISRSPDKLVIACRGGNNGESDINNGIFMLNLRHPRVRELVEYCIQHCERLSCEEGGFRCDQHAMQTWLSLNSDQNGHIALLHRYDGDDYNLFNYDGTFIRHVLRVHGTLDQRVTELRRLVNCNATKPTKQFVQAKHQGTMSFQKRHRILVAAPAAYDAIPASASILIESCRRFGIELTLIGQGRKCPNLRYKIELVSEYLQQHSEYDYVLQLDLKDIVCCATLREMFNKYETFGHAIVSSAERSCWPIPAHESRSPVTGTSCRYLNSGSIFSTRAAWLDAWDLMQDKVQNWQGLPNQVSREEFEFLQHDDQAAWSDLYIEKQADIALDAQSHLFQVLNYTDWRIAADNPDYSFEGRRIVNRETGSRPCLYHANGNVPLRPWGKYVLDMPTVWIWPLIDRIRTAPHKELRDVKAVQALLLELGLHQADPDLPDGCVDDQLLPYTGKGLSIWQRPDEFAEYLIWLSKRPPIQTYLEIGVEAGGSFITTIEFLKRFHPLKTAVGVDPWYSPTVQDYVRRTKGVQFVCGTRDTLELHRLIKSLGGFDLILIDGDHSAEGVRADWEFARTLSQCIAFHDISTGCTPGVGAIWAEIRASHNNTHEFISKAPHLSPWMGFGVVELAERHKGQSIA